jgi:DNA-binding response OmpR family regulator
MRILLFGIGGPGARKPLERALARLGHETFAEHDVEAALGRIGEMEIRTVIADGRMPKFEWIQLCRQLRSAADAPYVYFLLVEGPQSDESHETWALSAGVDDFLGKPADETELRRRLRAAAQRASFTPSLGEARARGRE